MYSEKVYFRQRGETRDYTISYAVISLDKKHRWRVLVSTTLYGSLHITISGINLRPYVLNV